MILIQLLQTIPDIAVTIPEISQWGDPIQQSLHISPTDWTYVAQQFETDVFKGFRQSINNFIQSGQVWALIIGIIIGYLLKSLTSYG